MEKAEAVNLAVKLVKPLVENKSIDLSADRKRPASDILEVVEEVAKGILDIEKKI